jgi:hypothetical protein
MKWLGFLLLVVEIALVGGCASRRSATTGARTPCDSPTGAALAVMQPPSQREQRSPARVEQRSPRAVAAAPEAATEDFQPHALLEANRRDATGGHPIFAPQASTAIKTQASETQGTLNCPPCPEEQRDINHAKTAGGQPTSVGRHSLHDSGIAPHASGKEAQKAVAEGGGGSKSVAQDDPHRGKRTRVPGPGASAETRESKHAESHENRATARLAVTLTQSCPSQNPSDLVLSGGEPARLFGFYLQELQKRFSPSSCRKIIAHLRVRYWRVVDQRVSPIELRGADLCAFAAVSGVSCRERIMDMLIGRKGAALDYEDIGTLCASGASVVFEPL